MNPSSSKQSLRIVDFALLYCRFIAALPVDSQGFCGFGAKPLSLSDRNCLIRRSGGAQ